MHRTPTGNRRNLRSDKDARGTVAQGVQIPADPLEGLPGAGQQHPYLRVGQRHFLMRQTEETAIEELLSILADQPLVGTGETTRAGKPADWPVPFAVAIGHGLLHDLAFAQQAPEVVIRPDSARHAVTVSDDGNGVFGLIHALFQCPGTQKPWSSRITCLGPPSRLISAIHGTIEKYGKANSSVAIVANICGCFGGTATQAADILGGQSAFSLVARSHSCGREYLAPVGTLGLSR